MSFLGGAAEQLTEVIETREAERMYEERMIKAEEREERRFAKRQAAAAARDRKKAEKEAEDVISALSVFYPADMATQIASKGKVFSKFALESAQTAVGKKIDPATLWNFATNKKGEVDQSVITETLDFKPAKPTPAPDDLVASDPSLSLNIDAYSEMFVEPDKYELAHNQRISVLDQKIARNPDSPMIESWNNERTALYEKLAELKEKEKEATGTTTPSFTLGTVASNMAAFDKTALPRAGFKLGINDQIENLEEGNMHMQDIASLDTVVMATEFNKAYDDPAMKAAIVARRDAAIRGLGDYAFDTYNKKDSVIEEMSIQEYAAKADAKQLKIGDIIKVGGFLHVYTGIPDIYNGQVFYDFKIGSN